MEERTKNIVIFVIIVVLILLWSNYKKLKEESLADMQHCESVLSMANDSIDEANSNIEDAQGYAWSSYDEMGWALDNLETVDNASF